MIKETQLCVFSLILMVMGCFIPLDQTYAVSADPDIQNDILYHRATYQVTPLELKDESGLHDIAGEMEFELLDRCDSWISNQGFQLAYVYDDGIEVDYESVVNMVESKDSGSYRFHLIRRSNGVVLEEFGGEANRLQPEAAGKNNKSKARAVYHIPEKAEYDLPSNVFFPTQHLLTLIQEMSGSDKSIFLSHEVFDGIEGKGAIAVSSLIKPLDHLPNEKMEQLKQKINRQEQRDKTAGQLMARLINKPAYQVKMTFFEDQSGDTTPSYVVDMLVFENSVVGELTLSYSDFSMQASLKTIEKADQSICP